MKKDFVTRREQLRGIEIRINGAAASVREWDSQLNKLLVAKKKAVAETRFGDERRLEHQIRLLEADLEEARNRHDKLREDHKLFVKHFLKFDRETFRALAEELGEVLGNLDKV